MRQNNTGINHKQIGNRIKEVREQNDYSQAKLAEELLAGVQLHNPTDYQTDIDLLMAGCSADEKRFIYELVKTSIDIMRKNEWHIARENPIN